MVPANPSRDVVRRSHFPPGQTRWQGAVTRPRAGAPSRTPGKGGTKAQRRQAAERGRASTSGRFVNRQVLAAPPCVAATAAAQAAAVLVAKTTVRAVRLHTPGTCAWLPWVLRPVPGGAAIRPAAGAGFYLEARGARVCF